MCIRDRLESTAKFDTFLVSHIAKFGHPGNGKTSYSSSTIADEFLFIKAKGVTDEIIFLN